MGRKQKTLLSLSDHINRIIIVIILSAMNDCNGWIPQQEESQSTSEMSQNRFIEFERPRYFLRGTYK